VTPELRCNHAKYKSIAYIESAAYRFDIAKMQGVRCRLPGISAAFVRNIVPPYSALELRGSRADAYGVANCGRHHEPSKALCTLSMITNGHRALRQWPLLSLVFWILVAGIRRTRATIVLYALAIICAFVAVQSEPPVVYVGMFGMGAFLTIHLLRRLHNAYAVSLFMRLANVTRNWRSKLRHEPFTFNDGASRVVRSRSAATSTASTEKMKLYASHALAVIAADRIDRRVKRKIFELYLMASWFYTVMLSMLIYALEYYSLYRVDPDYFTGTDSAGFWQFAKLSFELLTPASFSHIVPTSRVPLFLCYSEVAIGVIILAILVFSILAASREAFHEDIGTFTSELHDTASAIETRIAELYKLNLVQLELALLMQHASTVNLIRKSRGLSELPIPEAPVVKKLGQR